MGGTHHIIATNGSIIIFAERQKHHLPVPGALQAELTGVRGVGRSGKHHKNEIPTFASAPCPYHIRFFLFCQPLKGKSHFSGGVLPFAKYAFVIFTTTPARAMTATRFGSAMRPLRVSEISHISVPVPVAPTMQTPMKTIL